ncbi:hypothetical protein CBR_g29963 [Chara braunii]|uniref:PSP proline-rich domain-containing protein n=1 Tax=Chara braunii TaxID=69332 RepID=A0A388LBL0_CHABU|nr:hypothetical protein CBR_g29963 [Chara braunii]|eukprot:GBG79699.1 hypothetical protein CBR_g29963 [Chara braunii]
MAVPEMTGIPAGPPLSFANGDSMGDGGVSSDGEDAVANGTSSVIGDSHQDSKTKSRKLKQADKRRRRRQQKKKQKAAPVVIAEKAADKPEQTEKPEKEKKKKRKEAAKKQEHKEPPEVIEVEYLPAPVDFSDLGDGSEELLKVFEKFAMTEPRPISQEEELGGKAETAVVEKKKDDESDEEDSDDEEDAKAKDKSMSNKKKKLARRMKVAELKQLVSRPDVVEVWDTTAADPRLLVYLKAYRNTVPVPRHWCQKRKFLQGKRGIEKAPFQLPDFIAATGIEKLRQAYIEKEDSKRLKQKQRERMQPKMGKMDIDYQVLHDAFFKYQTKPKLTTHGDLYHEGKEFEVKLKEMKPGQLSDELKAALGMGEGCPPPWLINMQRYGPPPSYPSLKIMGLNAPIPEGASFGYHPGGWGKPPVDEFGKPLYGDVFGTQEKEEVPFEEEQVDKAKHWGDLEEEEEESEEEEEDFSDEDVLEDGIASVDTVATTLAGAETPDVIDLRKTQRKETEKPLYHVLEEKEDRLASGTLLGTTHTYVVPGADKAGTLRKVDLMKGQKADRIDITLRPEELEGLDDSALAAKYEQAREEEKLRRQREDFSDMVAENEKKRKRKAQEKDAKGKKHKEFKF